VWRLPRYFRAEIYSGYRYRDIPFALRRASSLRKDPRCCSSCDSTSPAGLFTRLRSLIAYDDVNLSARISTMSTCLECVVSLAYVNVLILCPMHIHDDGGYVHSKLRVWAGADIRVAVGSYKSRCRERESAIKSAFSSLICLVYY